MPSYSEMMAQIEALRKQAERQRKEEYSSVIKTIKKQIADYGISAEELGFASKAGSGLRGRKAGAKSAKGAAKAGRKPRGAKRAGSGSKVAPKYRDSSGNTWTGRGKMPRWLAQAVASGASADSFRIASSQ